VGKFKKTILVLILFPFFITTLDAYHNDILGTPLTQERIPKENINDLGEFVKGRDTIKIKGRLVVIQAGEEIPIPDANVILYMNTSETESEYLNENRTDSNGYFYFKVFLDSSYPTGEIYFTVVYPGSIKDGYGPTRIYYKAKILEEEPQEENGQQNTEAIVVIVLLVIMMLSSTIISLRQIIKRERAKTGAPMWKEIIDTMEKQAKRRDINFVLLVRELVDSLGRELGIIPKIGAPLQERLMSIEGLLDEEAYNIMKNLVAIYELLNYGGPYARTILMSSFDFDVWSSLLEQLNKSIGKKLGG